MENSTTEEPEPPTAAIMLARARQEYEQRVGEARRRYEQELGDALRILQVAMDLYGDREYD